MPWNSGPGAGFTAPGVPTWLPLGDVEACNVEDQTVDPASFLSLSRDLLRLRAANASLRRGRYRPLDTPADGLWAWERGDDVTVAVNLAPEPVSLRELVGTMLLCTTRSRDGDAVEGTLELGPWEAAIVARSEVPRTEDAGGHS